MKFALQQLLFLCEESLYSAPSHCSAALVPLVYIYVNKKKEGDGGELEPHIMNGKTLLEK